MSDEQQRTPPVKIKATDDPGRAWREVAARSMRSFASPWFHVDYGPAGVMWERRLWNAEAGTRVPVVQISRYAGSWSAGVNWPRGSTAEEAKARTDERLREMGYALDVSEEDMRQVQQAATDAARVIKNWIAGDEPPYATEIEKDALSDAVAEIERQVRMHRQARTAHAKDLGPSSGPLVPVASAGAGAEGVDGRPNLPASETGNVGQRAKRQCGYRRGNYGCVAHPGHVYDGLGQSGHDMRPILDPIDEVSSLVDPLDVDQEWASIVSAQRRNGYLVGRRQALEEAAKLADSQVPGYPSDATDEYRRGQVRGARDAASQIRKLLAKARNDR